MNLGIESFELFTAMVSGRAYEDVMDEEDRMNAKKRLHSPDTDEEKEVYLEKCEEFMDDMSDVLNKVNRKILLVFKTRDYLTSLDMKLGKPHNTFKILNDVSYDVFNEEVISKLPFWSKFS